MIKLIAALGNPGPEYELTRHNIAWLVVDEYLHKKNFHWKEKFKGQFCDLDIQGEKRYFLKPQTFMNLSGESIQPLAHFYKIKPSEILIIHDELDLPFGTIALKNGGGLAGHNGLKSAAKCLGTQDFLRLRVGIDRPSRGSVSNWVLSGFSGDQESLLGDLLKGCAQALESTIELGFSKAATKFSRKNLLNI